MPNLTARTYRRQRRSTMAKHRKLSSWLHVERLESRAHPSSSILGLAVGSLLADDNQYDVEVEPDEATTEQPSLTRSTMPKPSAASEHGRSTTSLPSADNEANGLNSRIGQSHQREIQQTQRNFAEPNSVQQPSSVPKWFESLSLSLLSNNSSLAENITAEPAPLAQLTAIGVTLPVGAPAAAQALMVTALGNSNVSSSEGQPTLPLFAAASQSNAGGGGGPTVTFS